MKTRENKISNTLHFNQWIPTQNKAEAQEKN